MVGQLPSRPYLMSESMVLPFAVEIQPLGSTPTTGSFWPIIRNLVNKDGLTVAWEPNEGDCYFYSRSQLNRSSFPQENKVMAGTNLQTSMDIVSRGILSQPQFIKVILPSFYCDLIEGQHFCNLPGELPNRNESQFNAGFDPPLESLMFYGMVEQSYCDESIKQCLAPMAETQKSAIGVSEGTAHFRITERKMRGRLSTKCNNQTFVSRKLSLNTMQCCLKLFCVYLCIMPSLVVPVEARPTPTRRSLEIMPSIYARDKSYIVQTPARSIRQVQDKINNFKTSHTISWPMSSKISETEDQANLENSKIFLSTTAEKNPKSEFDGKVYQKMFIYTELDRIFNLETNGIGKQCEPSVVRPPFDRSKNGEPKQSSIFSKSRKRQAIQLWFILVYFLAQNSKGVRLRAVGPQSAAHQQAQLASRSAQC